MRGSNKVNSSFFEVDYNGLTLKFELYSIDYIEERIKQLMVHENSLSIKRITILKKNITREFIPLYLDETGKQFHFFAYIKFFKCENGIYGLVGGKTNYPYPDVSLDYLQENDNRVARTFLRYNNFEWHNEIIIVNHQPFIDKTKDEKQALFIECFLQRQFNLFDS